MSIFAENMREVYSIAILAGKSKIGNLLAYLSTRIPDVPMRKMLKLIYLIDEDSVRKRGLPITWLTYKAWAKGPVAEDVFNAKDTNVFDSFVKIIESADGKIRFIPTIQSDMTEFSKVEKGIIDDIISRFGNKSSDELTDMTHMQDSLWSKVVRDNDIRFDKEHRTSDIVVKLEELLDPEGLATYNDAKESMEFQAALNCA